MWIPGIRRVSSIQLCWMDGNFFANLGPTEAKSSLKTSAILLGLLEIELSLLGSLIKVIGWVFFDHNLITHCSLPVYVHVH